VAITALLAMVMAPIALAKVASSESPNVASDKVIDDDLFIAGRNVNIAGTVNGNVYAAGQFITVSGKVNGDLLAAGQTVTVTGTVNGDVYTAAQNVQLTNATITNSVNAGTQNLQINGGTIGGGLLVGANSADIRTPIGRGIMAALDSLVISKSVGRDVRASANHITLESGAKVNGDLVYRSQNKAKIETGASVSGDIRQSYPSNQQHNESTGLHVAFKVWAFLAALLIGFLLLWLMRRTTNNVSAIVQANPFMSAGWGLLAFLLFVPVILVIMLTVIGIPLAIILFVLFWISVYLAKFFVIMAAGDAISIRLRGKLTNAYLVMFVGLLAYHLLLLVPFVNWLTRIFVILIGLGAWLTYQMQLISAPRSATIQETPQIVKKTRRRR